jgi:hypothetical protein
VVVSDAAARPFLTALGKQEQGRLDIGKLEQGRGRMSVALPPERPVAQVAAQAPPSRVTSRQAQPFDLMQFMRGGKR